MRPGDRKELEGWVRARTTPQRRVERARIVLGSAGGLSGRALAREIGVSLPTVQRWLDRYDDEGLAGLEDRPRPGRPRSRITPELEAESVASSLHRGARLATGSEHADGLAYPWHRRPPTPLAALRAGPRPRFRFPTSVGLACHRQRASPKNPVRGT